MTKKIFGTTTALLTLACAGFAYAPTGLASGFSPMNMMNPSKWMGGNDRYDDDYYDRGYGYGGPYGYPGYGYGGPGYGYGGPGYGYGGPGYGYGYGAPGYGYGAPGYGYGGAPSQQQQPAPPPQIQ